MNIVNIIHYSLVVYYLLVMYYTCWSICIGFFGSDNIKNNLFAEGISLDDEFQVSSKWS